jgi:hypothetical protein
MNGGNSACGYAQNMDGLFGEGRHTAFDGSIGNRQTNAFEPSWGALDHPGLGSHDE